MSADAYEGSAAHGPFLGPIAALARQKKTWTPQLLAGVVWRGLTNLGSHCRVAELLKLPALAEAANCTPRFAFKYLTHDYLVRGLTTAQRAEGFLHHYRRLHAELPDGLLRQILLSEVVLYSLEKDDHRFLLTLGLSRDFDKEGELSLTMSIDGLGIFLMCFTLAPGSIVNSGAKEVLLISRVQGMKGVFEQVHCATKTLYEVAPEAVIFAAVQGIALAFDVREIAAVSAGRQSSYTPDSAEEFQQAYDRFFAGNEIPLTADGFYSTPIPLLLKPMSQIKKGHKIRTKQKRAFKRSVQETCADFLLRHMGKPLMEAAGETVIESPSEDAESVRV